MQIYKNNCNQNNNNKMNALCHGSGADGGGGCMQQQYLKR